MPPTRHAQTGSDQPVQITHLALRCLVARVLKFSSEASVTGFVFLIMDPAVARLERDSALSGQLRPLCAFITSVESHSRLAVPFRLCSSQSEAAPLTAGH